MASKSTPTPTYVTPESVAAGRMLARAIDAESKAYGAVRAASVALWQSVGAIDPDGRWVPGEYPSAERLAIATLPNGSKGKRFAAPVGTEARKATQALPVGDPMGDWWRRVRAALKSLDTVATEAGRKSTRAASQSGKGKGKATPTPDPVNPAPVAAPVLRDTVAAVLQGQPVQGLSQADADAIRADAAAIVAPASQDATPEDVAGALRLMIDAGYASDVVLAACHAYVKRFDTPAARRTRQAKVASK